VTSQGEEQKKLDVISNDIFCNCLRMSGRTGVIASEEEATPVAVEETDSGNYIVVFDPLDGSSNIDAGEHVMGWLLSAVFESLLLMLWN
jgi:fructose-1,6-bisphosphatase I